MKILSKKRWSTVFFAAVLLGPSLQAHDFWIEPQTFRPPTGTTVPLYLLVGDHFDGEIFPRSAAHLVQFTASNAGGLRDIPGLEARSPAGYLAAADQGPYIVGYRSTRSFTTMKLPAFREYLREEGLDSILDRVAHLKDDASVREAFSRCAKSLLRAGTSKNDKGDARLGLRLELVASEDPYRLSAGDTIELQVLFEGRPLEGALLTARPKSEPLSASTGRSDAAGLTRLKIGRPGVWMVKTVHMIPAEEGLDADWESLWATLTFDIGE